MRPIILTLVLVLAGFLCGCQPTASDLAGKGITAFQVGDLDEAESLLEASLVRDPGQVDALYYMGRIQHAEGFLEQAIYYYQCALDENPGYEPAEIWLARAIAQRNRPGEDLIFLPEPAEANSP